MDPDLTWFAQLMPEEEVNAIMNNAGVNENMFDFNDLDINPVGEAAVRDPVDAVVSPERPLQRRNQHSDNDDAPRFNQDPPAKNNSIRNPNILSRNNRHNRNLITNGETKPSISQKNPSDVPRQQPRRSQRQALLRNVEDDSQYDDPEYRTTLESAQYKFITIIRKLKENPYPYHAGMIAYALTRSAKIIERASDPFVQKLIEAINTYPYHNKTGE